MSEQSYYDSLMSPGRKPQWVVYHVKSTMLAKIYDRKSDAVRLAKKLSERNGHPHAVAERLEYEFEVVYDRQVENLRFGGKVWEKSNLPYYLSVSSNTYWES